MYCYSCGKDVPVLKSVMGSQVMYSCIHCGLFIEGSRQESKEAYESSLKEIFKKMRYIIIAEDTQLLRAKLKDTLVEWGLTAYAQPVSDGKELIEIVSRRIVENRPVDLIIMDLVMPVLDGMSAALALRAIEDGLRSPVRIPILYFTVKECDNRLRKLMEMTKPCKYLNKTSTNPDELSMRLGQVLMRLLGT
jgi:CheY-like chemotaxis protein